MKLTELTTKVKIARGLLKVVGLLLLILLIAERVSLPPDMWWIWGALITLGLVAIVLARIGQVPLRRARKNEGSTEQSKSEQSTN